jgi:hypothetical protein
MLDISLLTAHSLERYGMVGTTSCSQVQGPASWLCSNAQRANLSSQKEASAVLLYYWWNVWKERSKRIFDSVQPNEFQVAISAKEDIELSISAFRRP